MCRIGMQEIRASEIKVDARSATAAPTPLCVVENVVSLRAKLETHRFSKLEELEQGHVKICPARHVKDVATRVAEGQTLGGSEGGRVEDERTGASRITRGTGGCTAWISNQVGVSSRAGTV